MIKEKVLCLGLAVSLSVGTVNYPSVNVNAKSITNKIEDTKDKIGDSKGEKEDGKLSAEWYDFWGAWHDPNKEPQDQYDDFGEYIGPEGTETPQQTEAPQWTEEPGVEVPESPGSEWTPAPQPTEEVEVKVTSTPQPTTTPKSGLEKPNKSYYTFWDRAEDIYKHPNKNFLVSDVKKGAVKQCNAKMPAKTVKWNKKGHATITLPQGKTYRLKLKGVKSYKRVGSSYNNYIGQKTGTTKYFTVRWTKNRSTANWKKYCVAFSDKAGVDGYGFKTNKGYFRVDVKPQKMYTVGKQSLYKNKSKISKYTWKSLLPNSIPLAQVTDYSEEAVKTNTLNEGYTKYCRWDKDSIYVQGYKCPKVETYGWKLTVNHLLYTCAAIDYAIDSMRIPSASKMSKEQCCKWIRRNSKQLINMCYNQDGSEPEAVWAAIYPIMDKASKYDLADKFTKNSLVYFIPTKIASKKLKCNWLKKYKVGSYDRERRLRTDTVKINGKSIETKGYYTWVGDVYGETLAQWESR